LTVRDAGDTGNLIFSANDAQSGTTNAVIMGGEVLRYGLRVSATSMNTAGLDQYTGGVGFNTSVEKAGVYRAYVRMYDARKYINLYDIVIKVVNMNDHNTIYGTGSIESFDY